MNKNAFLIWFNLGLLVISWAISLNVYDDLPGLIPTHFNYLGEPDIWGEKAYHTFYLLPAVQTLVVLLILVLLKYPHLFNFPQKDEVKNWPSEIQSPVYKFIEYFLLLIALLLNIMFIVIQNLIVKSAIDAHVSNMRVWLIFILVFMWLPLLPYFLIRTAKIIGRQRLKLAELNSASHKN